MKDRKHTLDFLPLFLTGSSLAILFHLGLVPSYEWGICVLMGLAIWAIIFDRSRRSSLLPRLMIILYTLPFIPIVVYLVEGPYMWRFRPQQDYLFYDRLLVSQMTTIGLVGLLGLLSGTRLATIKQLSVPRSREHRRSLDLTVFHLLLGLALLLSWLYSPDQTILTSTYGALVSNTTARSLNFNAASLFSYILLALLWVDTERDEIDRRRQYKLLALLIVVGIIVTVFQILRGNRDSIGLIIGLAILYLSGGMREVSLRSLSLQIPWQRIRRLIVPLTIVFIVFVALGGARNRLADEGLSSFGFAEAFSSGWEHSPWSGILLSHLGVTAQYRYGTMEYLYGQTYLDYALSLPPGVVTQMLGLRRPLEVDSGPNWWTAGFSGGGIHLAVVPFKNFGALGVFLILAVYGFLLVRLEVAGMSARFWPRLIYAAVLTSSIRWAWYGDMTLIRGLMIGLSLGLAYKGWLSFVGQLSHYPRDRNICTPAWKRPRATS